MAKISFFSIIHLTAMPEIPTLFRDPILHRVSILLGTAATSMVGSNLLVCDLNGEEKLILADDFFFKLISKDFTLLLNFSDNKKIESQHNTNISLL